jgi:hypothetical protein
MSGCRHNFKRPYKFRVLFYSLGFNADLLSEEHCGYGTSFICNESFVTYACLAANIVVV